LTKVLIFDSSIWIDQWRTDCHSQRISSIEGLLRMSSVVLAELRRGALRRSETVLIEALEKRHRILTPTEANWLESGRILAKMHLDHGFSSEKLRDLHFDIPIALTARSHGATLITSNRSDFELIHRYRSFQLEIW
jgi:predicted nucleic acid-binding protein